MLLYKLVFFKSSRNQLPSEFLFPFIFKKFILLIFGCAGSSLLCWLFSGGGEQGLLSSCSTQLFIVVASRCRGWAQECVGLVVVVLRLLSMGSVAVAPWAFSCPAACGIFPDQGSNLCLLHWQVGYLPLSHQGIYPVDF